MVVSSSHISLREVTSRGMPITVPVGQARACRGLHNIAAENGYIASRFRQFVSATVSSQREQDELTPSVDTRVENV